MVLFGVLAIARPTQVISADEGALLAQVRTLADTGHWSLPVHTEIDRGGSWFGLHQPVILGDRAITFDRPPTYPLLLVPLWKIGGLAAVLALHVLGVWAAALLAGRLTERLVGARGIEAMWLTGVLSPLLFDGYWAIAHSLVAAGAIAAVLGALRFVLDGRRWGIAVWLAGLVTAVGLRTEPLFLAAGLAAALLVVGWAQATVRWRAWGLATATVGLAGSLFIGLRLWQRAVEGSPSGGGLPTPSSPNGYLAARLSGFSHSVIGAGFGDRAGAVVAIIAAGFTLGALLLTRFARGTHRMQTGLAAAGAAAAVVRLFLPLDLVTGLLIAAPLIVGAALCVPRQRWADPATKIVAVTASLTVAAVVATQHERGGTGEWGGRYFHVVLPLICVLAVVSMDWLVAHRPAARTVVTCGLVVCAAFSGMSLREAARGRHSAEVRTELAWQAAQKLGPNPVIVNTWIAGGRFAWRHVDEARYLTVGRKDFPLLGRRLEEAGIDEWVLLAQPQDLAHIDEIEGYELTEQEGFGGAGWSVLVMDRAPAAPVTQG